MKPIYLFSPKIKYKNFLTVWDKFPIGGIKPMHMDKIIWQMIRDKQIYVFLENKKDEQVFIATKLPQKRKILMISNPIIYPL